MAASQFGVCGREVAILPLATQGEASVPARIKILPKGWVKSLKGNFLVDDQSVSEILTRFTGRQLDLVVDYEHQTLSGEPAPAAGWIKGLKVLSDGVWGRVEWTETARTFLTRREYRYLSPVVMVRRSDQRAIYLHSVALNNTPAIDGMEPIVNSTGAPPDLGLDPDQVKVNRMLGIDDETFLLQNSQEWTHPDPLTAKIHRMLGIDESTYRKHGGGR